MKLKSKMKNGLDFFMTGLLLALMAYQITGQELHEWCGVSMSALFLAHNILNAGWYKGLFRGRYTALRLAAAAVAGYGAYCFYKANTFCSHGGGRFGQSLTAIAKLAPDAVMGEALSVHYSGGSSLAEDVAGWLKTNQLIE